MVLEAGCIRKRWIRQDRFNWVASGTLLEEGICIDPSYQNYLAPEKENTKVECTIEYQSVRNVDAKEQTLSFDLVVTLVWSDPYIRTNIKEGDKVILSPDAVKKI